MCDRVTGQDRLKFLIGKTKSKEKMSRVGIWRYTNLGGTNSDNTNQIIFQFQQIKICFYQIISFAFYIYFNLREQKISFEQIKATPFKRFRDEFFFQFLAISAFYLIFFG